MNQITRFLISHGGLFLFPIVLADQSGLPFPAVPWLLAAGALAAGGKLSLLAAICWAALGSLAADMIWFYLGQRGKRRIFRVFPDLESRKRTLPRKLHTRLILRGVRVLTAAKFLPFGTVVPLRAGALEVGSLRFFLIDAFSSVVYAAVYVVLGFIFHSQLEEVVAFMRKLGVVALLLLVAVVGAYLGCVILKRPSKRTRHLNQSRPQDSARENGGRLNANDTMKTRMRQLSKREIKTGVEMKPHGKLDGDLNLGNRIRHCLGTLGAVLLAILLNGCASVGGAVDPDALNASPWQYNPNTGYPAVGGPGWVSYF